MFTFAFSVDDRAVRDSSRKSHGSSRGYSGWAGGMGKHMSDPAVKLPTPILTNLIVDPKEEKPYDLPYLHSWVGAHVGKILKEYAESIKREPLIPAGAPLNYVPSR